MSYESETPNLGLPQWEYTDKPQMADFNAAFAAIDGKTVQADDYVHLVTPAATYSSYDFTLVLDPPLKEYTQGLLLIVNFPINFTIGQLESTAPYDVATLNINGLGKKILLDADGTDVYREIEAGPHPVLYRGESFCIMDATTVMGGDVYHALLPVVTYMSAGFRTAIGSSSRQWDEIYARSLYLQGQEIADFVVEQGESGNWTYRKWYRGRAEGWFRNSYASPAFSETTGSGSLCEMALFKMSAALPSGLFAASPNVVTVAASRGTGYYPLGGYINERSASSLSVVVWSTIATGITDLSVELYAVGRWK